MTTHGGRRPNAGRPAGRLKDLTLEAREIMKEKGYNPIEALVDIAQDDTQPGNFRMDAHKTLAKYYAPELKSVDITGGPKKGNVTINVVKYGNLTADQVEQLPVDSTPLLTGEGQKPPGISVEIQRFGEDEEEYDDEEEEEPVVIDVKAEYVSDPTST